MRRGERKGGEQMRDFNYWVEDEGEERKFGRERDGKERGISGKGEREEMNSITSPSGPIPNQLFFPSIHSSS